MVAFTHIFILFVWLSWSSGLLRTYPVFLSEGRFVPQSHLAMSRDSFSCYNWGVGLGLVVLTSSGQRPGMLPNTPQRMGQLPRAESHLTKTVVMSLLRNQGLAQQTLPGILLSQVINVIDGWYSSRDPLPTVFRFPKPKGQKDTGSYYVLGVAHGGGPGSHISCFLLNLTTI